MKGRKIISILCAASITVTMLAGCQKEIYGNPITVTDQEGNVKEYTLSNENSTQKTFKIFKYICETYGKNIISAQQESTWMGTSNYEMNYIREITGKVPAMRGLDFMNNDFDGVVRRARIWDARGGLVTICWHTGVKSSGYQESLDENPDFDKLLTEGTDEYEELMESWDKAAKALQQLQEADVTVFWRPFHEFNGSKDSGSWFWWGKGGAENFVKLWRLMYDKFTNEYGLNNLIWVLGYTEEIMDGWYPGDDYCDIIGSDTYDGTTNANAWEKLSTVSDKPKTFHECENIPSVEKFIEDKALWSWFMIWHTDALTQNDTENLNAIYNSDFVITLDELPEF